MNGGRVSIEERMMETERYGIFCRMPDGNLCCVREVSSLEQAQIALLLLESDYPGDYVAFNETTGKLVTGVPSFGYVC